MEKTRLLAVDMGNTSVTFGWLEGHRVLQKDTALTHSFSPATLKTKSIFRKKFQAVLISSVVPEKNVYLSKAIRELVKVPIYTLGEDLRIPIRILTKFPEQVGIDRLINALEAFETLKSACIVVDFGTAITFDVVSKRGDYMGGLIAPGVELTLNALYEKTSLLPHIRLTPPRNLIGKTTEESIRAGCAYGLAALCDGILSKLMKHPRGPYRVISTGGYARFVSRYATKIKRIDEDLILKGISTVYSRSRGLAL